MHLIIMVIQNLLLNESKIITFSKDSFIHLIFLRYLNSKEKFNRMKLRKF